MIKNRAEIIEQLAKMLMDLEAKKRPYQTDIYLYLDEDGCGTLEEFVNPGGSSFRNDKHYTLFSDNGHAEFYTDDYDCIDDILDAIGKEKETIISEMGADADIDDFSIRKFIEANYRTRLQELYREYQESSYYHDKAALIIEQFENDSN